MRLPTAVSCSTLVALAVAVAVAAVAAPANAQEPGVDRTAAARSLFEEGLELLDSERWAEAADRFQRALALRPSPEITYNLTIALVQIGHLVRATELLRQVGRDPTASLEVREAARARRAEILPRLGQLTVHAEGNDEGVTYFLDERPVDRAILGVAVPVDPGRHVVTARRGSVEVDSAEATLTEGGAQAVTLRLGGAPTPRAVAASESDPSTVALGDRPVEDDDSAGVLGQWWFWTGIAVLVAGAAVTAVLLAPGDAPDPVGGNLDPSIIRGRVAP